MRNPLNDSDVNGNTMAFMADQDRENAPSYQDQYRCDCGELIEEHEFIHELKMCQTCYGEHYRHSYISADQAEHVKGDR